MPEARKKGERSPLTRAASKGGFKVPKTPLPSGPPRPTYCGAKKRGGGKCTKSAGWGTDHLGIGKCKFHGGSTITHVKAAATEEYRLLLGSPMEINPIDALIMCIKIRAGEVKWLSDRIVELDQKAWIEQTIVGKQFHLYARERQKAMQDLARYSQMAVSLGIAERHVKLYETYGETLARLIQGILGDLELNAAQRAKVPQIVRKHLLVADSAVMSPSPVPALAGG